MHSHFRNLLTAVDTSAALKFYLERAKVRRAILREGIFHQLASPKLRTHIELEEEEHFASDPFASVTLALHWNTNGVAFVLDRAPIGRVSDIRNGRYKKTTIVVGGYEVRIKGGKSGSAIQAIPVKQNGRKMTDIGEYLGVALQTNPYVSSRKSTYPMLADYCNDRIFYDLYLSFIDDVSGDILRWIRYLRFLIKLVSDAVEEKWEMKTY